MFFTNSHVKGKKDGRFSAKTNILTKWDTLPIKCLFFRPGKHMSGSTSRPVGCFFWAFVDAREGEKDCRFSAKTIILPKWDTLPIKYMFFRAGKNMSPVHPGRDLRFVAPARRARRPAGPQAHWLRRYVLIAGLKWERPSTSSQSY